MTSEASSQVKKQIGACDLKPPASLPHHSPFLSIGKHYPDLYDIIPLAFFIVFPPIHLSLNTRLWGFVGLNVTEMNSYCAYFYDFPLWLPVGLGASVNALSCYTLFPCTTTPHLPTVHRHSCASQFLTSLSNAGVSFLPWLLVYQYKDLSRVCTWEWCIWLVQIY